MAQLPSQSQFGDYGAWPGRDVLDSGGERLGGVREIYLDRETGRPEWVLVDVDGDEARFVPLADAAVESSTIRVAHSAEAIRKAPGIGSEARIDQSEEQRLYDHYGIGYADAGSGLPAEEPTREHEQPAAGSAPDASEPVAADTTESSLTGAGTPAPGTTSRESMDADPAEDPAAMYMTDPTPAAFSPPDDEPETAELIPPWRAQSAPPSLDETTPEPESSWSAAAGEEPSNLAPPAAEPPSPEELEEAHIPEPPAATDRAADFEDSEDPITPAAIGPDSPTGLTAPSGAGEILATGAAEPLMADPFAADADAPAVLPPAPEPELLAPGSESPDALSPGKPSTDPITAGAAMPEESSLTAQPGPDVVGVFSAPTPEPEVPRPFTPPSAPEAPAKSRRGGVIAGVTAAAVLFFIVRKLR